MGFGLTGNFPARHQRAAAAPHDVPYLASACLPMVHHKYGYGLHPARPQYWQGDSHHNHVVCCKQNLVNERWAVPVGHYAQNAFRQLGDSRCNCKIRSYRRGSVSAGSTHCTMEYTVQSTLWGKVQVTVEHVNDAGGVRRLVLKALLFTSHPIQM